MKYPLQKDINDRWHDATGKFIPIRDQSGKMRLCAFLSENRCITSRAVYLRQGNVSDKLLSRFLVHICSGNWRRAWTTFTISMRLAVT